MSKSESPFLCHSSKEFAKILWEDGQAIGFFSAKTKGSKCESFLTQRYELPILDNIFVRKSYRGRGYGLQLLEDFVDSFTDDALGLRYPLPLTMYKVCKQYLEKYPSDHDLLWEVEGVGHLLQRINIARKLQTQAVAIKVSEKKQHIEIEDEEPLPNSSGVISERREQNSEIEGMNNVSDVNVMLEENEGNLGLTHILSDVPEDFDTTPISARTRHSNLRRPKLIRTTELHCSALNTEAEIIPETHLETVIRSETDITEEATISVKDQKEDKTQEAAVDQIAEESTDEEMSQNKVLHTTDVHNSSWKEETVVHELHKTTINGSVTEETLIQEHTRCNPFNNVPPPQSDELDMEAVAEPVVTEPEASPLQEDLNSAGDTHIIISNHKQEKTEVVDSRETIDDQPLLPNESESDLACSESAGEELSSNDITSAKCLEASSASSFMASNTSASEEDLSFQEVSEAVSDQNKGDLEEDGVHEVSLQKLEEQMHSTPNATKKVIKRSSKKVYLDVPMRRESLWREAKAGKSPPLKKRRVL
ncbi:soluble lamin-associated protein of 75 kDa [Protopterus annectens]|uniref:soluble lamin-associated protein of 75 kDa n=1 Tax=Protopterus annectens TaxID=7888 RepID=UPI001CFC1BEE|nr:soluble lamin-associated protein of 75 kDa [Protopterus annectens]